MAGQKETLRRLKEEDRELGAVIDKLQASFNEISVTEQYREYAFVTYDDLAGLASSEGGSKSKLIVIKASPGTEMEVPSPEELEQYFKEQSGEKAKELEDKKYILYLRSKSDEIKVYTVENEEAGVAPSCSGREKSESEAEGISKMFGE